MALPAYLTLTSLGVSARSIPVIASVVLHASVAVGLVASAGGHARAGTVQVSGVEPTVDVDTTEQVLAPPRDTPEPRETPEPRAQAAKTEALPTHTHPYPVDPSHDAHPHDPAQHHDDAAPAPSAHEHEHDAPAAPPAASPAAAPAAASPALVADGATLPKFDLSAGSGAPMGARVAASATGNGAGAGTSSGNSSGTSSGTSGGDDVVHAASSVQVAARVVQQVKAAYPIHAREDMIEGDVVVEIVVDREGRVVEARVTRPAGNGFDEAALAAVRGYRFSPAQREGHAVRVRMPWTVNFRLH